MGKKIAIHCKDKKEWKRVEEKRGKGGNSWEQCKASYPDEDLALDLGSICWSKLSFYEKERNYTIISAAEYLNEGGKDVSEFKVKDEVEILAVMDNRDELGKKALVIGTSSGLIEVEFDDGDSWWYDKQKIKHTGKKPKTQTTKENNMDLNSSIRTVFVDEDKAAYDIVEKMQNVFGEEIKEDFTGAMTLRNNKAEYLAEIKRLDDIEAKRLKEEAKKK